MRREAAFAIPGDLQTRTGGYVYERRLLESLNQIGLPVRHVPLITSWPHPTPQAERDLARQLATLPPGLPLILDGLVFGAMETALLAAQPRPVIAMLHHPLGLEAGLPPDRARALIARETANLRHAAHVVVPSAHTRDILVADFEVPPGRISVALPGFDRPQAGPPVVRDDPPLILSVGIICTRKGHDVLLDALARVAHLDWQAAIVGLTHEESVRQSLLAQRARLDLDGRVRLTGVVSPEDLDRMYRAATLFALATRYEGYGMALSEAQLHGLPILSCAVGAVPQTLPPGAAILTAPDDPDAFAQGLADILTDPQLRDRLATESRRRGRMLPEWTDTAQVMRAALDRLDV